MLAPIFVIERSRSQQRFKAIADDSTKIAEVFKTTGKKMLFLFDYGEEWRFQVELRTLGKKAPNARYPRLVASVGDAPSQYGDDEDE